MAAGQQYLPASARNSRSFGARIIAAFLCCAAVLVFLQLTASAADARDLRAGDFDYYALALSWSPTFCESKAGRRDHQQCASARHFAFVVHGLWPQYESGWPENCDTSEKWVPESAIGDMLDIMPSRDLVIHEWRKHGSCSGLGIAQYFSEIRALFARIRIPARYLSPNSDLVVTPQQLSDDFVKTNPGLAATMMSIQCGNRTDQGRLSELRICFDRERALRNCGDNEKRQCRAMSLILPRVR